MPVAAAPAFLIAGVAVFSAVGAVLILVMVGYLESSMGRSAGGFAKLAYTPLPLIAFGLLGCSILMAALARAEFRLRRNPPLFTADGVRLRVFARHGHDIFVSWDQVLRLRLAERSARPYLMIDVQDAEALVGPDPRRLRSLHHTAERYDGATFVYAMRGALIRPDDLAATIDRLTRSQVHLET